MYSVKHSLIWFNSTYIYSYFTLKIQDNSFNRSRVGGAAQFVEFYSTVTPDLASLNYFVCYCKYNNRGPRDFR